MFCGKCGQEMVEGARFCPNCGQPVKTQESNNQEAPFVSEEQYTQPVQYNEQEQTNAEEAHSNQEEYNNQGQYNGAGQYNNSGQYNNAGQYNTQGQYNNQGQYNGQGQYNNPGQYNGQNQYNGYGQYQQGHGYSTMPEQKSKVVAGLLQIFLGCFGIGRFYLGYTGVGIAQLLVSIFTCGLGAIWPFVDGILILCGQVPNDANGVPLKD